MEIPLKEQQEQKGAEGRGGTFISILQQSYELLGMFHKPIYEWTKEENRYAAPCLLRSLGGWEEGFLLSILQQSYEFHKSIEEWTKWEI
ncbi:hypothetical protein JTE90_011036 [Oedothorax gibbosus]|uniref:Uncharacterized protein n=1 Tax=Oedothorax gibbosus TaxID=931172 RepID=A0AAV6VFJ3_9ARAC|nr:hypothetical protein JTE90_011036 [Oedothorax gibbosus]